MAYDYFYKDYYTYIVECFDGIYYVGMTNNIDRRLREHNNGLNKFCFTYERRPVKLVYYEHTHDVWQAIFREKQIKGWSRRKKQALIDRNYDLLPGLSKSRGESGLRPFDTAQGKQAQPDSDDGGESGLRHAQPDTGEGGEQDDDSGSQSKSSKKHPEVSP
jgi:putative endonuclease